VTNVHAFFIKYLNSQRMAEKKEKRTSSMAKHAEVGFMDGFYHEIAKLPTLTHHTH
jgi:hypothetical protein